MQVDELRRLAEQRGWTVVGEYIDKGVSGSKERRPELDRLMRDVARGRINLVACWKFDRFARSVSHLVKALDDFRIRGINFVSVRDQVDTSTATGKFTFHILAAVAELERELMRDRTVAGLQAARRRGARLGRPPVRVDVATAVRLRQEGMPMKLIAGKLRCGLSTLRRGLRAAQERGDGVTYPLVRRECAVA